MRLGFSPVAAGCGVLDLEPNAADPLCRPPFLNGKKKNLFKDHKLMFPLLSHAWGLQVQQALRPGSIDFFTLCPYYGKQKTCHWQIGRHQP